MEKKFVCKSCGNVFMADTNKYVTCPSCESDNVEVAKGNGAWLKWVLIGVGGLAVVGAVVAIVLTLGKKSDTYIPEYVPGTYQEEQPETPTQTVNNDVIEDKIAKDLPMAVVFKTPGNPIYDKGTKTYTVTVTAEIQNGNGDYTIEYSASPKGSDKEVATSKTGKFTGLAPITDKTNIDCTYVFTARAMKNGECVMSETTEIADFKPVPEASQITPMTVAEMQALLQPGTSVSKLKSDRIAANAVAKYNGKSIPLAKVLNNFTMGIWDSVKVNSLQHDDMNRVIAVNITPQP